MIGAYDGLQGLMSPILAMSPDIWAMISVLVCLILASLLGVHCVRRFKSDVRQRQLLPSVAISLCNRRILASTLILVVIGVLIWAFRVQIFVRWLKVGGS